eukprot:gnl/TRDRNA2_/TRDRNA2_179734_c0_seq1.p1 gnl/TRDRNA2_/TRDRNA2_179734_c0~~gnl/TRDRNA2_/TRDRNA2_179734_c0_seq1.p1  ORF type:complete len:539 (+),score=118.94 gnl/TRDRNA2_/TRDRNA2_179734_c0_seq1:59-1675(+)
MAAAAASTNTPDYGIKQVSHEKLMRGFTKHHVSENLKDRYPYLEDINSHLKTDEVTQAAGDRLFPRLVEQLKQPDNVPEVLSEALCCCCELLSNQEYKCMAVVSDVVAAATNLLVHSEVQVQREAARTIEKVATGLGGRSCMPVGNMNLPRKELVGAMPAGPTLPRLAKLLLGCNDEVVKMNVAAALRAVAIFRDGCQQVVDQGTVKAIATYLNATLPNVPSTRPLATCLLDLLRTLASVTMYARDGMRDVLRVGLIGRIIAFLGNALSAGIPAVTPAQSVETIRNALRVLWHCGNDPQGRKEALAVDGVCVVTGYLGHTDAKVREGAVCALNVISLETPGKAEVLKHSTEPLAALLHSSEETPYLHETCVQLCRCASELPAFRFAFARHVLASIWLLEKVYGTTALAAVSPLLKPKENAEVRAQAAQVMSHFLQQEKPARGDEIRVPPVSPLRHIDQPLMFCIEECTGVLHDLIALLQVPPARDAALECMRLLMQAEKPREELVEILESGYTKVPDDDLAILQGILLEKVSGAAPEA